MQMPELSEFFKSRSPSALRMAQIEFSKRTDNIEAINTAIGNVTLPAHPAIQKRLFDLNAVDSPFHEGVVKYTSSIGMDETNKAFKHIIAANGYETENLYSQVVDGASQGMELITLGACGPAGTDDKPLMLIDASYTNYNSFAERVGRTTVSVTRELHDDGTFSLPTLEELEDEIIKTKPGAIVVIPYDNPTGQLHSIETMILLAKLCVKYNMWLISDEAYRGLYYKDGENSSIWALTDKLVPGIEGRRIGLETASKVWNACGLRIGAVVTDSKAFHEKSVAEYTANLCANAIGQYAFGALAYETHESLNKWFNKQRAFYKPMMAEIGFGLKDKLPGLIVSKSDAAFYSVLDVRNIAKPGFSSEDFVRYCAQEGNIDIGGRKFTLLVAPMSEFYSIEQGKINPGNTQMRIAFVERPERMILVPHIFSKLFIEYEAQR